MTDWLQEADAVITHNVVPMRAEPKGGSEQISQAILNDLCCWQEESGEFVRIRTEDQYEGWVFQRHVARIDARIKLVLTTAFSLGAIARVTQPIVEAAAWNDPMHLQTKLVYGTRLHEVTESEDGKLAAVAFFAGGGALIPANSVHAEQALPDFTGARACEMALRFLGTPYLWGGTTPFGFDCSGFVQRIYNLLHVVIPRDAYQQAESSLGTRLSPEDATQAGDLVFFGGQSDPRHRGITHVGMALDAKQFVHAVGKEGVIITPFEDPYYSEQYTYRGGWRYSASS